MLKKTLLVLLGLVLLFLVLYGSKIKRVYKTTQFFDHEGIVNNFRTTDELMSTHRLFPSTKAAATPSATPAIALGDFLYQGERYSTQEYLDSSFATAFIVSQHDTILHEQYLRGHSDTTQQIVWSVSKSFLSALFGIAIDEGKIKSVKQKVEEYCPELIGSGYEGVLIEDVLQMSTGVGFNEDYGDFWSDINKWGRGFAWGSSQDEFAASLQRVREPGTHHHYVSINTHVLGMVLVSATGQSITDYAQEKLWEPLGMVHASHWLTDDTGMEMALGGLNTTARTCLKLGLLFKNEGVFNGQQIVSKKWVQASVTPDKPHLLPGENAASDHDLGYGYQWWVLDGDEGEFLAIGVYNQYVYINPTSGTVIVKHSANPGFNEKGFYARDDTFIALCRAVDGGLLR